MSRQMELRPESLRRLIAAGEDKRTGSSGAVRTKPWAPVLGSTQQKIFDAENPFILMHGNRGGGKCVARGSFVTVAGPGLVQLGGPVLGVPGRGVPGASRDLDAGVYAMGNPGEGVTWERTGTYYFDGSQPAFGLRTAWGYRIVGTAGHKVYCREIESGDEGWMALGELAFLTENHPEVAARTEVRLQAGSLVDKGARFHDQEEPKWGRRTIRRAGMEIPLTEDTAWMLGYMFFGGAHSDQHTQILRLPAKEENFSLKFKRVFLDAFGIEPVPAERKIGKRYNFQFENFFLSDCCRLSRVSSELNMRMGPIHNFLEELGVLWHCRDKDFRSRHLSWEEVQIPPEILGSDRKVLGAFLVGAVESSPVEKIFYRTHPDAATPEIKSFDRTRDRRFRSSRVVFPFPMGRARHTLQQLLLAMGVRTFEPVPFCKGKRKTPPPWHTREGGWHSARLVVHPDDLCTFYDLGKWTRGSRKNFHELITGARAAGKLKQERFTGAQWVPVHETRGLGVEIRMFDLHVPRTECYVANGIVVHNTYVAMHKMVRHCWEEFNALGLIIVGVRSQATQGGAWDKLQLEVLPDWKGGINLEFTDPRMDEQHYKFIHIRNRHGGWSKIVLMSMPVGYDVTGRMRGFEPSMAFVDELTTLRDPAFFDAVVQQLGRRPGIEGPQQYLAATNPDGPSHWVYHRFFEIPLELTLDAGTGDVISPEGEWDDRYATFLLQMEENKDNLPKQYIQQVYEGVRRDPYLRKRLLEGIWVDRPVGDGVFADHYREEVHVVRNRGSRRLTPNPGYSCVLGYDLGKSCNSISFLQPVFVSSQSAFTWLLFDEMVYIHRKVPYRLLVNELYRRMNRWNKAAGTFLQWHHVSDDQAFNQFNPTAGSFDHFELQRLSKDVHLQYEGLDPLVMKPAPKFDGSVEARVRTVMDLLTDDRILVAEPCRKHRDMFQQLRTKNLKPGEYDSSAMFKPRRSVHLHPFDSLSYPILHASLKSPEYARPPGAGKKVEFMDVRLT